ncbi:uncharacterized protein LOC128386971 [Panonychus citri]|uniref:uncharacterized protein LOC128386971 n=1 Tax=Panonychus citri TaxID=50023 RepID=UPI00230778AC|nr:uncharacterized protein LOC128386971 [Panonychus citri]
MDLVVSSELQMFQAIVRWFEVDENTRKQYLPELMKFINFYRMNDEEILNCVSIFESVGIDSNLRQGKKPRAYLPQFCQFDCKINRHYDKSLISIYELGKDKIYIRRLSRSNLWTKYGQFTRDETMSTSLIEADHIVDVIYDSGRKGIRVDLIGKKFKYLKMFGGDNSYYGQAYKYFAHDYTSSKIRKSYMNRKNDRNVSKPYSLEAISLDDCLAGIYHGNADSVVVNVGHISDSCGVDKSHDQYFYCTSLDYRKLSSYEIKGPVQTRYCFFRYKSDTVKVVYFLTSHEFFKQMLQDDSTYVLDYSFLKDFIGSDSLDHIELISHNNSILICNKESKMIYSFNGDIDIDYNDSDYWQFMSKIESPEKMITIASICLPIDFE